MPKVKFLGTLLLFFSITGHTQVDTLIIKLDSLRIQKDSTGIQQNIIKDTAYNENTRFTFSSYFILLGSDLKQEITAPFHFKKRDWLNAGKVALTTGALMFADEPMQRFALKIRDSSGAVRNISKYVTNFGGLYEAYTLAALGTYGLIFKNEKIKTTTLLATQAYVTGAAMESLLKLISGRQRPNYYYANALEAEPQFHGPFSKPGKDFTGKRLNSSFPSGHATVAFAAATVFAMEYKDKPYISILSYTVATLIGISRISENKHWITDVFVGAVLGYYTGKQVVNNYHRYAKLKEAAPKKKKFSFNLDYSHGSLFTGIAWKL